MSSDNNHLDICNFMESNNFFGYEKEYVLIFPQSMLPTIDFNGKILLANKAEVALSGNGNGGLYETLMNH